VKGRFSIGGGAIIGGQTANFYIGVVPEPMLPTFELSSLAMLPIGSPDNWPFGHGQQRWVSPDLIALIGLGGTGGPTATNMGVNLYLILNDGRYLAQVNPSTKGGALLAERRTLQQISFDLANRAALLSVAFDLVWVQKGGALDGLYYNRLTCKL
jgi:hypothetical protein